MIMSTPSLLLGGDFINLVNLGLIKSNNSYVDFDCRCRIVAGQAFLKGLQTDEIPNLLDNFVDVRPIGNKSAGLAFQKY